MIAVMKIINVLSTKARLHLLCGTLVRKDKEIIWSFIYWSLDIVPSLVRK